MSDVDAGGPLGTFEAIGLDAVDLSDERYRLTVGDPSAALVERIDRWGCLVPPVVVRRDDGGAIPVAGFRRLRALARFESPASSVTVRLLPGDTAPLDVLTEAAREVRRDRELGPFEVARAIGRAFEVGLSRPEIVTQLLPELGLEPHDVVLKRHLKLARVPESLARWLATKGVSLRRALRFVGTTKARADLLVAIAERAKLSLRALEECARMLTDVARRDDRRWADLARETGLWVPDVGSNSAPAPKAALKALWRLRYPQWAAQQKLAEQRAGEVGLPASMHFAWDDTFERDGLDLQVNIVTLEALRDDLRALAEPERLARISALLETV